MTRREKRPGSEVDLTGCGWWSEVELEEGDGIRWSIGPLSLWAFRRPAEWRIAWESRVEDRFADRVERCEALEVDEVPGEATWSRFASRRAGTAIRLSPRVADRSIVSRPETPFHLLAGDEVELYVSSPVWVALAAGDLPLMEVPTRRLTDTWFGTTRSGELCFGIRTSARLVLAELPKRSYRAITPVLLRNRAEDSLLLERLSLPVPHLGLFCDREGHLWTEPVTVERGEDGAIARVRIGKGPPHDAPEAKRIAEARTGEGRNVLVRALGALLG